MMFLALTGLDPFSGISRKLLHRFARSVPLVNAVHPAGEPARQLKAMFVDWLERLYVVSFVRVFFSHGSDKIVARRGRKLRGFTY